MGTQKVGFLKRIDWTLLLFSLPISLAGLATMQSYGAESFFFDRQVLWICISVGVFIFVSLLDLSFLKNTKVIVSIFLFFIGLLFLIFVTGHVAGGARSWFSFGGFSVQPSDFVKLSLVLVLAKYFSRRHVAIGQIKHIVISGIYALLAFILVFLQPDFGTAMIIGLIWLGMALVAGIRKRHLGLLFMLAATAFGILWFFVFAPYQKARITSFLNPLGDIYGAGYNARQAVIAVGSGGVWGKGLGYGTQSRLQFLPEYETDFIFAAFAEEWGFVGSLILLLLYGLLLYRILLIAIEGSGNFETLFATGIMILFISHVFINVGMNMGLLPVTGITLPFMSYGGSHLITEFAALGMLSAMRQGRRKAHPEDLTKEFEGL